MSEPIVVVVTGAAGQIAYSLLYMIAKGDVFGPNQKLILNLLDIPPMMGVLEGVVMELADCALPLLHEVKATDRPDVAFKNASAAFLVGAMPRKQGMERKDLLSANVKIFREQGQAMNNHARPDVKVLVVGNPANTNALVCSWYAPNIPPSNFTAMTRLDQNRAQSQIAQKLNAPVEEVSNVIIWGNHSSTQYPDATFALHKGTNVTDALNDDKWLRGDFITTVQKRGAAVIAARKMSSAMSAAKAAADHMRDWFGPVTPGRYVSMGVLSDGKQYGVPEGIIFSFPVQAGGGGFTIVPGLVLDDFSKKMLEETAKELLEERDEAKKVMGDA